MRLNLALRKIMTLGIFRLNCFRPDFETFRALAISYAYGMFRILGIDSIGNLLGRINVAIKTTDGISFKCRIDSVSTISQISSWFREISQINDSPVKAVIDVGAHVGIFSLYASRHFKQAIIFAIEPSPENYELLLRNV